MLAIATFCYTQPACCVPQNLILHPWSMYPLVLYLRYSETYHMCLVLLMLIGLVVDTVNN